MVLCFLLIFFVCVGGEEFISLDTNRDFTSSVPQKETRHTGPGSHQEDSGNESTSVTGGYTKVKKRGTRGGKKNKPKQNSMKETWSGSENQRTTETKEDNRNSFGGRPVNAGEESWTKSGIDSHSRTGLDRYGDQIKGNTLGKRYFTDDRQSGGSLKSGMHESISQVGGAIRRGNQNFGKKFNQEKNIVQEVKNLGREQQNFQWDYSEDRMPYSLGNKPNVATGSLSTSTANKPSITGNRLPTAGNRMPSPAMQNSDDRRRNKSYERELPLPVPPPLEGLAAPVGVPRLGTQYPFQVHKT